jgi:phage terminase small subunit
MGNEREAPLMTTKAPSHLQPATRAWFAAIEKEYRLEEHHRRLLALAGQAWDRCESARVALAEHGTVYVDRFGAPRVRPEVAIERDARLAFARLVRELDLDFDPPSAHRRRPSLRSNRGE